MNARPQAPPAAPRFHSVAWLAWALAAASAVQLAPSPVYVALIVAIAAFVVEVDAQPGPFARAFPILVSLGLAFALVRVVLAALTTHTGLAHDVVFTTPSFTVPRLLGGFTVGGSVELPVILQAAAEGVTIVGVMAVFGAFNAVTSHYELVQSSPRAFYELGLVLTVALAFVPSTVEAIATVREADRARTGGRPVRRGRLLRQAVPVIELGLERAIALSESMDSRGFARGGPTASERTAGWCTLGALLALAGAFVALVGQARAVAAGAGAVGVALVAVAIASASASSGRTRYRPRSLVRTDWLMIALAALAPIGLALDSFVGDPSLTWVSTPLHWPGFHLAPAVAIACLLAPTLPARRRTSREHAGVGAVVGGRQAEVVA